MKILITTDLFTTATNRCQTEEIVMREVVDVFH